jgi:hypothetical protein
MGKGRARPGVAIVRTACPGCGASVKSSGMVLHRQFCASPVIAPAERDPQPCAAHEAEQPSCAVYAAADRGKGDYSLGDRFQLERSARFSVVGRAPERDPCTASVPTAAARAEFAEQGFLVLDELIDSDLCVRLAGRLERVLRGGYDRGAPPDKFPKDIRNASTATASRKVLHLINVWKVCICMCMRVGMYAFLHSLVWGTVCRLAGRLAVRVGRAQPEARPGRRRPGRLARSARCRGPGLGQAAGRRPAGVPPGLAVLRLRAGGRGYRVDRAGCHRVGAGPAGVRARLPPLE